MINIKDKRIIFIDIAKGITIICVVLYHIGVPDYLIRLFNLFFMPLFIIISGILLDVKMSFRKFIRKKVRRLLGPFTIGIIIGFIIECFIYNFETAKSVISSGFYNFWIVSNVPLWFLLTLFYLMIIVYAVENLFKKEWIKILVYTILSMIGFFMSIMHIINSLFIGQALLVIPFFVSGYKFKEYWLSGAWINWKLLFLCLIVAYFSFYYVWTNIHQFIFSPYYFPSLIAAFAFIMILFNISHFMAISGSKISNFLAWFGKNTIFILILHDLFVPAIKHYGEIIIQLHSQYSENIYLAYNCTVAIPLCMICIFLGKQIKRLLPAFF
ncbi:MAG: acyltransferase [Clostridia bacterium]|nr:acyltransferase [Clostridia bacterium]